MKKIESVDQVIKLANDRKAIFVKPWSARVPAAFLQNWQARMLHQWIERGQLFEYEPKNPIRLVSIHSKRGQKIIVNSAKTGLMGQFGGVGRFFESKYKPTKESNNAKI